MACLVPGVLTLSFDEPVDLASFNSSGLQIMQYAYSGYGGHHRLNNYSAIAETDYGRKVSHSRGVDPTCDHTQPPARSLARCLTG